MRILTALLLLASPAYAGGFYGGFAKGMERARALELDAKDGGNRYQALKRQEELEEIREKLKRQRELLEDLRSRSR